MRMVWSDEPPNDFNWKPVRLTVKKLVSYSGSGKKVVDVLQSRAGNNMCSTRASGPMLEAWHALGDALSKRRNLDGTGGVWKTKDAARQAVDRVHERAEQGRQDGARVKVTAFSFSLADATQLDHNSRFTGPESWHCVWLIDGGTEKNTGRLYFVAYDQDVTCTARVEAAWTGLRGNKSEEDVEKWGLDEPGAKQLIGSLLLGGRDEGPLGPLIRFLYLVD